MVPVAQFWLYRLAWQQPSDQVNLIFRLYWVELSWMQLLKYEVSLSCASTDILNLGHIYLLRKTYIEEGVKMDILCLECTYRPYKHGKVAGPFYRTVNILGPDA